MPLSFLLSVPSIAIGVQGAGDVERIWRKAGKGGGKTRTYKLTIEVKRSLLNVSGIKISLIENLRNKNKIINSLN